MFKRHISIKNQTSAFIGAAPPHVAAPLFDALVAALRKQGVEVATGIFGAKMAVELLNDGPVTLILEVAPSPLGS